MRRHSPSQRSGQALIELVTALVAVMVILTALVQLGGLAREQLFSIQEAREEADTAALSAMASLAGSAPTAIRDWTVGADGKPHTADDQPSAGSQALMQSEILMPAQPQDLQTRIPGNAITALLTAGTDGVAFDAVRGDAAPRTVPLDSTMRTLIYNADSITIRNQVWMPWTGGLP